MPWEHGPGVMTASIPGYELIDPAGEGGMGRVFVARQTNLNRLVAIKFLSVDHDADPEERYARFAREAEIMASLKHPNVLAIHDFGEDDGRPYLVMEFVEGGDLRRRMPKSGPMPIASALAVLMPVAEALQYLHDRGILHRDLKPENILMQGDIPKVADFGIAVERSGSGELTRSGQGLGTLGYVAPELQYRLPVDERADQYSLAAMSYELLTGQRPLGLFKPPSHHNPALTPEVDRVVLRGLEEEPKDRFASVSALVEALRSAVESEPPAPPRRRRGRVVAFALVPLLIAAAGTAFVAYLRSSNSQAAEPIRLAAPTWPEHDTPVFRELTNRRAHQIWITQGSPEGAAGNAVREPNWRRAQEKTLQELQTIARVMWASKPRSGGEEESLRVWSEAERRLLDAEPPIPPDDPAERDPS